jgi:cell wall assembly regulator SMI1
VPTKLRAQIGVRCSTSLADDLQDILAELEALACRDRPALHARFRPGLPERELEVLARSLEPYFLPAELVELYRWHDGWQTFLDDDYQILLPSAPFNSLAEAIAHYESWLAALGSDGWHPLWFPAFGDKSGELVILQLEPDQPAGPLYSFDSDALELCGSYDSVAALFATISEGCRAGVLPHTPQSMSPEIRAIAARLNPLSRMPDGSYRSTVSRLSTERWPLRWREALGMAAITPGADERVITIADLVTAPGTGRPIRAELRGWGGSSDRVIATAIDSTGSIVILLDRNDTENFREFVGGHQFEVWLVPLVDRIRLDELAAQMQHIADVPDVSYLATRIRRWR